MVGGVGAAMAVSLNYFKVPPLIPALGRDLGLSASDAGALMSVYAVAGLVVAAGPTSWLLARLHPKRTVSLGCALSAAGALVGVPGVAAQQLLAARFLEGLGMGIVSVAVVVLLSQWFPAAQRSLPLSLFSTWMPVGNAGMLYLAPFLLERSGAGWRGVWGAGGGIALAGLVLLEAVARDAPGAAPAQRSTGTVSTRRGLPTPALIPRVLDSPAAALAAAFALFQVSRVASLTWLPTFFVERGMPLGQAAALASLNTLITIPLSLVAGALVAWSGSARRIIVVGLLTSAPALAAVFFAPLSLAAPLLMLTGAATALVPAALNIAAPEARGARTSTADAVAMVAAGRNVGLLVGPVAAGIALQTSGHDWALLAWGLTGASLLAAAVTVLAGRSRAG